MTQVIIDRFDGGKAEDIRTHETNQSEDSYNFDLYTNPHLLIPIRDSVDETYATSSIDDIELSDVLTTVISGTAYLTAIGYETAISPKPAFYIRASGMNGAWSQQAVGTGTFVKGTGVTYKEKAYCLASISATTYDLERYNSAGSVTSVGTITVPAATGQVYPVPRPFIHPEDNVLYMVIGNVIAKWDGTTFTSYTTILPSGYTATSMTNYGSYLAISVKVINGVGKSVCYLWGRDGTLNTLQGTVDFGEGDLNVIANIGNSIVGLVYPKYFAGYSSVINNRLDVKIWAGGAVDIIKSIDLGSQQNFNILKLISGDKLYFGIGLTETQLWVVYKNKAGAWVVTRERHLYTGGTGATDTVQQVNGINAIGDYFYLATTNNAGTFRLRATADNSSSYSNTSKYKTTINPNMYVGDRYKEKQLLGVRVTYVGSSSGTTTIKYTVDGGTFTTIQVNTNASGEQVFEAGAESDGTPFKTGREFQFQVESTGNAKIKEIAYIYQVIQTQ